MQRLEWQESVSLATNATLRYASIAFDGTHYFATSQMGAEILQLGEGYVIEQAYPTIRQYDLICYDGRADCFWASTMQQTRKIFRLNRQFCEIDAISVAVPSLGGNIVGLAYHYEEDVLMVAWEKGIWKVEKGTELATAFYECSAGAIGAIGCICPGYVVIVGTKEEQFAQFLDAEGEVLSVSEMPMHLLARNMIWIKACGARVWGQLEFFVLQKGLYPYLYRFVLPKKELPFLPYQGEGSIAKEVTSAQSLVKEETVYTKLYEANLALLGFAEKTRIGVKGWRKLEEVEGLVQTLRQEWEQKQTIKSDSRRAKK